MVEQPKNEACVPEKLIFPWYGYVALCFAIIFFSGVMAKQAEWLTVFDFNTINGSFGVMKDAKANFQGQGGLGARDGFMFGAAAGLGGRVDRTLDRRRVERLAVALGGLKAGQKLLSPLLRPILGLPGIVGLALVTSMQSTDAGAGMTKMLRETDCINEKERTIFAAWQFSGGGMITNYLAIGTAVFSILSVPIALPLAVIFILKFFGANVMRLYLIRFGKEV